MECPQCKTEIGNIGYCGCGWKRRGVKPQDEPRPRVECCFAGCPNNAVVKVKTKTGWANVCVKHDLKIVQERADEFCRKLGLDTVEKQREWLLKNRPQVKRYPMREPGWDDEEIAA